MEVVRARGFAEVARECQQFVQKQQWWQNLQFFPWEPRLETLCEEEVSFEVAANWDDIFKQFCSRDEVLSTGPTLTGLIRSAAFRLGKGRWVSDEVMNSYFMLLQVSCVVCHLPNPSFLK
jgi:hypothetical protein